MTPSEKAQELYDKFYEHGHLIETPYAKRHCQKCVHVVVDEILLLMNEVAGISGNYFRGTEKGNYVDADIEENYWKQVKCEIEKL